MNNNKDLIISKYKELVEHLINYIEWGGGNDNDAYPNFRSSHVETMLLFSELYLLQEQESIKPIAVTSEEYYSRDRLFERKKKEPTGNFEKFSLLKESESITSFDTNFYQTRDLTDEEWLNLPKEEILQLYKNCYAMLQKYINLSGEKIPEVQTDTSSDYPLDQSGIREEIKTVKENAIKEQLNWQFPNELYIEYEGVIKACNHLLEYLKSNQ